MRVLSLHPMATELMFSLGAGNMLVGRTDDCDYPDAALSIPSIGSFPDITLDAVSVFDPQLVLLGPGQQYGGAIETFVIAPQSLDEVYATIRGLARRLGKEVEGDMLTHDLEEVLEQVQLKSAKFRTVRVHVDHAPAYVLELVRIAGGEPHSGEDLQAFNPQIIITTSEERADELGAMRELAAVQCERVFCVEQELLRPTPRLMHAAKRLAKILHGVEVNGAP